MRIGVIGVGSIGSVNARGFAKLGHDVVVNDVKDHREERLGMDAKPKRWMAVNCDMIVITVPTPTEAWGGDASYVDDVLSKVAGGNALLVIRSTMPPGETERLAQKYDEPLVYYPEFLRDRSDVDDFFTPDRIVLAGPEDQRSTVRQVVGHPRIKCDTFIELDEYLPAELGKEGHNAFFATKVSFANQMRMIAEEGGADPSAVMDIVTADHRNTTSHLDPMLGPYGGMCLPKDTEALAHYARDRGVRTSLLRGTIDLNQEAKRLYEDREIVGNWPNITVASTDGAGNLK